MIAPLRNEPANVNAEIGCTVLTDVFYLPEENWIPIGDRFAKNIMVGRSYEAEADDGASILSELRTASGTRVMEARPAGEERYGRPFLQRARLGQGSFRTLIIDLSTPTNGVVRSLVNTRCPPLKRRTSSLFLNMALTMCGMVCCFARTSTSCSMPDR